MAAEGITPPDLPPTEDTLPTVPEVEDLPFAELDPEGVEPIPGAQIAEHTPALSGLRRFITERRLQHSLRVADRLQRSSDAHQEAAAAINDNRVPATEAKPATWLQRRQAFRAARRQHKANNAHLENLRLKMGYGDAISDPEELSSRMASENLGRLERGRQTRTANRYARAENRRDRTVSKVEQSAEGSDIPGRVIDSRIRRARRRAVKLQRRLDQR